MRPRDKTAKMLRADLADAGIQYRDNAGLVADFHSLRHTSITNLARGGVHPKVAQQLARHSTITMTLDRYSHTVIGDLADGLDALPELSPCTSERECQRATGTCDITPKSLPLCLPISLPTRAGSEQLPVALDCTKAGNDSRMSQQDNPAKQGVSCTSVHRAAPACAADESLRVLGLEPRTYGLKGRCSTTELHPPSGGQIIVLDGITSIDHASSRRSARPLGRAEHL